MSRPLSQGSDITMLDVVALNRMIRRVMNDPKRYPRERDSLIAHLKGAATILLNGERAEDVLTVNTEVAAPLRQPAKVKKGAAKTSGARPKSVPSKRK